MPCCKPLRAPSGPEWEAVLATGDWPRMLAEAEKLCAAKAGCCSDVFKMKAELDASWLSQANGFLDSHGLRVEVLAFYTSDGKSSTPHL